MKWLAARFRYAFAGLRYGAARDRSVRFQFLLALLAIAAGFLLKISREDWFWIALSITLVITCEIFNSCIEKTVDYISLERNIQARMIKDMAAAAVFCTSLFALFCACMIFGPALLALSGWQQ